jgi:ankyrin repeat protein
VRILLDKGADASAQGGYYGNALQTASHKGHDQIVQQRLEKGADVNGFSQPLDPKSSLAELPGRIRSRIRGMEGRNGFKCPAP